MTLKQFAEQNELRLELHRIPFRANSNTEWDAQAKHFLYKLYIPYGTNAGKSMRGEYSQGSGVKGQPKIDDILNSIVMDIMGIEGQSFKIWAGDLGYSEDSIKALEVYQACLKEAEQLRELLGYELYNKVQECETL